MKVSFPMVKTRRTLLTNGISIRLLIFGMLMSRQDQGGRVTALAYFAQSAKLLVPI